MSTADDDSSNRRCALLPVQYQASRKCDLAILQYSTAEPGKGPSTIGKGLLP